MEWEGFSLEKRKLLGAPRDPGVRRERFCSPAKVAQVAVAEGGHVSRTVTIDDNCRVLLPEELRVALNLQPGDELVVEREGMKLVLRPKLEGYARRLRGLHKEVWKDVDANEYVRNERASWE